MAQAAYYEGNRTIRHGSGEMVEPKSGEAQLKISHCGICGTDSTYLSMAPWILA